MRYDILSSTRTRPTLTVGNGKALMATLIVCHRCRGTVQPEGHACPRCRLVLTGLGVENASAPVPNDGSAPTQRGGYGIPMNDRQPSQDATTVDYGLNGASSQAGVNPYVGASV